MHPCIGSILNVYFLYFTIKYNVFYKYIIYMLPQQRYIPVTRLFDVGQREVIFFIYVSLTIIFVVLTLI